MNQIIVAIDFSKPSIHAANYAADMAAYLNKEITLVHVIEIPLNIFQVPLTEVEFTQIESTVREGLDTLRQNLLVRTNNQVKVSQELRYGIIDEELEKLSEELRPFAIVMGINKDKENMRFFLGSNTLSIIPDASYPVLIVPEGIEFRQITNIAIASDIQETYKGKTLDLIKAWLKAFVPHCDIVQIRVDQNSTGRSIKESKPLLEQLAEFNPQFHCIDSVAADTGILDFIKKKKPDLLAVFPEKHGRFGFLFHKSISKKLVLRAPLPILSVAAKLVASDLTMDHPVDEDNAHDCLICNGACKTKNETVKSKNAVDEAHQV